MDLAQYARVLRAHWVLVALSVLVCTAAAGALAWTRDPVYAAQSQLFVATGGPPGDPDLSQTYQGGLFSQQRVRSYAELVSSPPVAQAVIKQLGLRESLQEVQRKITASVPENTVLINVRAEDRSRRRARDIANAAATQFPGLVTTLETPQGSRTSPIKVSVTRRAQLPGAPDSPKTSVYIVLGVLLGLVLGVGGAVLREAFDRRIKDEDEVAAITGAPVIGNIAEDRQAAAHPVVMFSDPSSVRAEEFRRLRTNLNAVSVDRGIRSLVITSAVESEGKTVVAANLGVAMAQAGLRVVLVDADLRRPKLAEVLGVSSDTGLTNVLVTGSPVEFELQKWRDDIPLEVLGSGPPEPASTELLGSDRFASVFEALRHRADVVLVDAPALLPVTDAAILARVLRGPGERIMSSGVILVARADSTRSDQLDAAAEALRAIDENLVGVVLNRSQTGSARPYHASSRRPAEPPASPRQRAGARSS